MFGVAKPRDMSPVDIHVDNLQTVLIGGGKLDSNWQTGGQALRKRIEKARRGLPDVAEGEHDALARFRANQQPTYYDCVEVFKVLENRAGDGARNWLGGYKDEYLKEWGAILSTYEKRRAFLGEGCRLLERNVNWEIPYVRKRITTCDKEITDLIKKVASYEKTIKDHLRNFQATCDRRGIQGIDLRRELVDLCSQLPRRLNDISALIRSPTVEKALEYYSAFVESKQIVPRLNILRDLRDNAHEVAEFQTVQEEDPPQEINWDTDQTPTELVPEDNGKNTLLSDDLRDALQNDVVELEGFLSQRLCELKSSANDGLSLWMNISDTPSIVRAQSVDSVKGMLGSVQKVLERLVDPFLLELFMIKHGGALLDRIVDQLARQKGLADKLRASINQLEAKRSQLEQEKRELVPKLDHLISSTQKLKSNLEASISSVYNERKVHILGC
uniref:Uncharacterized protein n=1 Tax=Mucochytrium quahogii TaxID=96639 RepID=A0A7S2WCI7_9STRA|mmetsp:Transcript_44749/g.71510  ORF Transcript_44749/g.71510 Transcript_44749/m.71510 type:complete len:444 (+) Transcript_44749:62-1393(+)